MTTKRLLLIPLGLLCIVLVWVLWPKQREEVPRPSSHLLLDITSYKDRIKPLPRYTILFKDEHGKVIDQKDVLQDQEVSYPDQFKNRDYYIFDEKGDYVLKEPLLAKENYVLQLLPKPKPKPKPPVKTASQETPPPKKVEGKVVLTLRLPALRLAPISDYLYITLDQPGPMREWPTANVIGHDFLGWDTDTSQDITKDTVVYAKLAMKSDVTAVTIQTASGPYTVYGYFDNAMAQETLTYMNQFRKENGLKEFVYDPNLQSAANLRAAEISYSYSHTRPNGRFFNSVSSGLSAENMAYGQVSAHQISHAFYNSADHRATILNPENQYFATGYFASADQNNFYWVQLFY